MFKVVMILLEDEIDIPRLHHLSYDEAINNARFLYGTCKCHVSFFVVDENTGSKVFGYF